MFKYYTRKRYFYWFFVLLGLWACEKTEMPILEDEPAKNYSEFMVAGYLPYYSFDNFNLDYLSRLDRIYYFSVAPDEDGNFYFTDADVSNLNKIKEKNTGGKVEIYLVIGGWYESETIHAMAADPVKREKYIKDVTAFCVEYSLHGVDLDWEAYPIPINETDFVDFVKELSPLLKTEGLGFSVAVAPSHTGLSSKINAYVDEFNLMSYGILDANGDQVPITMLNNWLTDYSDMNIPKEKIIVGVPFYGKRPYDANDQTPRAMTYRSIVSQMSPGPFVNKYGNYGFNGRVLMKNKALYLAEGGYKGIMSWELSQDVDYSSEYSLLKAICNEVHPEN